MGVAGSVVRTNAQADTLPIQNVVAEALKELQGRTDCPRVVNGVPSGIAWFDRATGGLQPGTLTIVGGFPGVGTTSLVTQIAMHATLEHAIPTWFFSLDVSASELVTRMLASESSIDISQLRRGLLAPEHWKEGIYPASKRLDAAPLIFDECPLVTAANIVDAARRFRAAPHYFPGRPIGRETSRPSLGLLVIDTLDLVAANDLATNDPHAHAPSPRAMSAAAQALKALAVELEIPVLVTSTIILPHHGRRLHSSRIGTAVSREADLVTLIHRKPDQSKAQLVLAQHRRGPTGCMACTFRREYSRFDAYAYS